MQRERSGVRRLSIFLLGGACVLAACAVAAQSRQVESPPVELQPRPMVREIARLAPRDCSKLPALPEPTLAAARKVYVAGGPFELRQVTAEASRRVRGTILRQESGPLEGNRCWVDLWVSAGPFGRLQLERVTPVLPPDRAKPEEPPPRDDVGPAQTPTDTVPEQPPAREVDCKALPALPEPTLAAAREVYSAQRRFEIRRVTPVNSSELRGTVLRTRSGRIDASRCWVDLWVSDGTGVTPPVEPADDTGPATPADESPPIVQAPRVDCYALPEFPERTLAGVRRAVGEGPFEIRSVVNTESTRPRGRLLRVESGPLGDDRCWLDLWVSAGPPPEPEPEPEPEPQPEPPPEPAPAPPPEPQPLPPPEPQPEPPPLPPPVDCSRLPEFPEPTLDAARQVLSAAESFQLREVIPEASELPAETVLRRASGPLPDGRCWMDLWVSDGSLERVPRGDSDDEAGGDDQGEPPPGFDWRWALLGGTVLLAGATFAWRRLRGRRRKSSEGGAAEVELRARLEADEARTEGAEEGFAAPPLGLRARLEPGTGPDIEFDDGGDRP